MPAPASSAGGVADQERRNRRSGKPPLLLFLGLLRGRLCSRLGSEFGSTLGGPSFLCHLAAAGDTQRVGGNILGDGGPVGDVSAVADGDRSNELGAAADENALTDGGLILLHAVVVAGDRAGANVGVAADGCVA